MADVWTIYRTRCTMCGDIKEFQSEMAARSYTDDHQRCHDNAPISWASYGITTTVTNPGSIDQ